MGRQSDIKHIFENERVRSFVFWFAGFVLLDQIAKIFAFRFTNEAHYIVVIGERILGVQLFKNYDFAFSVPIPTSLIFFIYFVVLALILVYVKKNFSEFDIKSFWAWTLILSGALSNIVERVITSYVKDFIFIYGGGIFNFADFYILFGIVVLLYVEFSRKKL